MIKRDSEQSYQGIDVGVLVAAERERLVRLCGRLSGSAEAAEDLAHETVIEAYRNAHKLHDPQGQTRWLAAIARHVCLRWARRYGREAARRAPLPSDEEFPTPLVATSNVEVELTRAEVVRLLERALTALPAPTRAVLVQHYIEESTQAQVALRLGLSEGAVAMRLRRGKLALRRLLAADLATENEDGGVGWEATRIWCPVCGRHPLHGRLIRATGELSVRCLGCTPPDRFLSQAAMPLLHHTGSDMQGAVERLLDWMDARYWQSAPPGLVRCVRCERPVAPVVGPPVGWEHVPQVRYGVITACAHCGTRNMMWLSSQALAHPAGRAFWREQRRVRLLPERAVEAAGRAAIVIGLESAGSADRLEIVTTQGSGEIVAVYGGDAGRAPPRSANVSLPHLIKNPLGWPQ